MGIYTTVFTPYKGRQNILLNLCYGSRFWCANYLLVVVVVVGGESIRSQSTGFEAFQGLVYDLCSGWSCWWWIYWLRDRKELVDVRTNLGLVIRMMSVVGPGTQEKLTLFEKIDLGAP